MERGNVLVIGNSGVGKSTLINAVLGEERAETGYGTSGTTDRLTIYESDKIPFRIIDTVGFEPSIFKEMRAINAVKKWSQESAEETDGDKKISVIWFCVDGTSRKLFPETIRSLSRATAMWESVPVIVVITKSYSVPERSENVEMVHNAFARQKRYTKNLRKVIPVVASTYTLNESAYAPPDGIDELIEATNELLPEGVKAGEHDVAVFRLSRKRALAQGIIGVATASAVVVGAVPIPLADSLVLSPIEIAEINALAQLYEINKDEQSKQFFNSIIEAGAISTVAKAAISALKAIPGIDLAASVINAIVAGSFVSAIGEGTLYAFEQVYLGKKSITDVDWVRKVIKSEFAASFLENVKEIAAKTSDSTDSGALAKAITEMFEKTAADGASKPKKFSLFGKKK